MSETTEQIDRLIDWHADFARQTMIAEGGVHPMYALNIGQQTIPVVADFQNEEAKEAILNHVRAMVVAFWPQSVAFIMECWTSRKFDKDQQPLFPRASQDPDREEGVLVLVATPEMERGRVLVTQRDAEGKATDLVTTDMPAGDMDGKLSGLYPTTPPSRQIQRRTQRALEPILGKERVRELRDHARSPVSTASH